MNVSVNWLRALVPGLQGSAAELADEISQRAVPVESVVPFGAGLEDVVVGRVEAARKHPNADRLTLCQVDDGSGEPLAVVCGAPNVEVGAAYPFVRPGGTLPGGFKIESREIRGETSHGMLCSEKELGLGADSGGIMKLDGEYQAGAPFGEALGMPDARLELDLTPNRVDLAGHLGVARELAAAQGLDVTLPDLGPRWEPEWVDGETAAAAGGVVVEIESAERCPRYLAAVVRGVEIGPSPDWLAARIMAAGSRPINNIVDATNYVLLELNQPIHAFDLDRLEGPEIRVRTADGESITTLDGGEHELGPDSTVIADRASPVALAGVMGGAESQVTEGTADLLIECAAFAPAAARVTARRAGLSTDASYRFERGIDESGLEAALQRCVELILQVASGRADPEAIRVGRIPGARPVINLRPARVRQLLGLRLDSEQLKKLLEPLGFEFLAGQEEELPGRAVLPVAVPGWRRDVTQEVDLLEEVARAYGYDSFPQEPRRVRPSSVPDDPMWLRRDRVADSLAASGLYEARSLSFVPETLTAGEPVRLKMPLSSEETCLRTDLLPGLVRRLEHNYSRGRRDVRLFEIGSVFQRVDAEVPFAEQVRVGAVLTGAGSPAHWAGAAGDLDVWDLKGLAETMVESLGLGRMEGGEQGAWPGLGGWLVPGSYEIVRDGIVIGRAGQIEPRRVDSPPWGHAVFGLEFELNAVALDEPILYRELPVLPAVPRDLSVVLPEAISARQVADVMRAAAPETLESLNLFDVFVGEDIDQGQRSLGWRLVFRHPDRTLTDGEVEKAMASIRTALEGSFDVRFRGS
ncbi:MAG: phenylalanine--tRNA ligase subunit beta [Gemmatimonadota bacterium]